MYDVNVPPTTPVPSVAEKTVAALERLAVAHRAFGQQVATEHRLTPLQVQLLELVAAGPPPPARVEALRRELQLSQPTVSDAAAALHAKGLIRREPDPADGRRHLLTLTPAGGRVTDQLAHRHRRLVSAVAALPADQREEILGSLLQLIAALHRAGVITVARTCLTCRFHAVRGGHYCTLLELALTPGDLRVNCPEHQLPAGREQ